jgi:transcriptional regulator with XRE-family HTH domain
MPKLITDLNGIAFRRALVYELKDQGSGSQNKLGRKSGISVNLINDIVNARTTGSLRTRLAIAKGLDYDDTKSMIDHGRAIIEKEEAGLPAGARDTRKTKPKPAGPDPSQPGDNSGSAPSAITLLVENRNLRLELERISQEIADLKTDKPRKKIRRSLKYYRRY